MEVKKTVLKSYGYTVRRTKDPANVDEAMYMTHIERLGRLPGVVVEGRPIFERKAGLHCHGVIVIPKALDLKRFRFRGWHIHLEEIYDPQGWYQYLTKEQEELPIDLIDPPDDSPLPKRRLFTKSD